MAKLLKKTTIVAFVTDGELRDAKLAFAASNQEHGLQRSNAQKRAAVMIVLTDEQGYHWTDKRAGDHCGVSNTFVGTLRGEYNTDRGLEANHPPIRVRDDGQTVNVGAIGSKTGGRQAVVEGEATPRTKANTVEGGQAQGVPTNPAPSESTASAVVAAVVPAPVVAAPTVGENGVSAVHSMSDADIRALACKRAFESREDPRRFVMDVIDDVEKVWNVKYDVVLTRGAAVARGTI